MAAPASAGEAGRTLVRVRGVVLALVVVGCALRFGDLGGKVFWYDETCIGLAIAGTSRDELRTAVFDGRVHTRDDLLVHQFPRPETSLLDTVRALARDEPRHPPLYCVLAHGWTRTLGSSVCALRSLSAVLSVLCLPLVFLLYKELFGGSVGAWVAVGVVAVSPVHLVYAQEARQYTMWAGLVLLSCWLLLRAVRSTEEGCSRASAWFVLYGLAVLGGLATHLLTLFVMAAHILFASRAGGAAGGRLGLTPAVRGTLLAQAAAGTLFAPWALLVLEHWSRHPLWIPWAGTRLTTIDWLWRVASESSRIFLDLGPSGLVPGGQILGALPLAIAAASAAWLWRAAPRQSARLLVLVAAASTLPLVAADAVGGGWRTIVVRYQFPTLLAVELAVAWAIARLVTAEDRWRRRAGAAVAVLLLGCGAVSAVAFRGSEVWWNKGWGAEIVAVADHVNRAWMPLLLASDHGGASLGKVLSLAHELDERVRLQLVVEPAVPVLPHGPGDLFAWDVSEGLLAELAREGWRAEPCGPPGLVRLHSAGSNPGRRGAP